MYNDFISFTNVNTYNLEKGIKNYNVLLEYNLLNVPEIETITRKSMNFLDLSGILGGIVTALLIILELIYKPLADHSFFLTALQSLYLIK